MFRERLRNFFEWMFSNLANGLGRRRGQRFRKRRTWQRGLPRNGIQSAV